MAAGFQVGLDQLERLGLLRVTVGPIDDLQPDALQHGAVIKPDHRFAQRADERREVEPAPPCGQVDPLGAAQPPLEVLDAHRQYSAVQVPQVVGQAAVIDVGEALERELPVAAERALAHEVEAERLGRELADQVHRLDHVAQALAQLLDLSGLLVLAIDKPVSEDLAGRLNARRHQHRRPECAMEPRDILADHVHIGRPEAAKALFIGAIADGRDVVEHGVEPDVDRLAWVEGNLDAPGEPLAGDGHVLQLGLDQVDDLVAAAFGLNELGMLSIIIEQAFTIRREPEIVVLLLDPGQRRVRVVGALAARLGHFLLGLERLAAGTVMPRVDALVDVAGVVHGLDELAAADVVPLFAGLDEIVVRDLERAPDLLELPGHVVHVGFGFEAKLLSTQGHLVGVLIVPHQEVNRGALHAAKPGLDVSPDLLERRADMRPAVGVIDRRRDVKPRRICHRAVPILDLWFTNSCRVFSSGGRSAPMLHHPGHRQPPKVLSRDSKTDQSTRTRVASGEWRVASAVGVGRVRSSATSCLTARRCVIEHSTHPTNLPDRQTKVDWPWHKDYDGRRCAYVELDATGVRQQGEEGGPAEGRMAYVGMVCNPCTEWPRPDEKPLPMQARYLSGLYSLENLGPLLRTPAGPVGMDHADR